MQRCLVAAFWLAMVGSAHAAVVAPSELTFGSKFTKAAQFVLLSCDGHWAVQKSPPWVTVTPSQGDGPFSIGVTVDKAKAPAGVRTTERVEISCDGQRALDIVTVTVITKCDSTSAGCGGGPHTGSTSVPSPVGPTRSPATAPTPRPTATVVATIDPEPQATIVLGYRATPYRPTGPDVSFGVLSGGYPFKWCPLRVPAGKDFQGYVPATQPCIDAMTETSLVNLVGAVRVVRAINGSANAQDFMLSDSQGASAITAFLNPVYEGNFGEYRGDWGEDWDGKDYHKPRYGQRKARSVLLANPVACAQAPEIEKFLGFLNLAIEDGRCVDAPFAPPYPDVKLSKTTAMNVGMIDYDVRQPPLTGAQLFLLHETHRQHKAVSDWRCGVGPQPAAGVVQAAHLALEASARNETELHRLMLKAFSGDVDPRWSRDEECRWARWQDHDHERWMQGVEAGDWAASRKAENDHSIDHLCMNLRHPSLKIRRTDCGDPNVNHCPVETCFDVLRREP